MHKSLLFIAFFGFFLQNGDAQSGFEHTFGSSDGPDFFNAFLKTSDGGYALTGSTQSATDSVSDLFFFRADAFGEQLVSKKIGNAALGESGQSILSLSNGDFLISGYQKNGANSEAIFARFQPNGGLVWWKNSSRPNSKIWGSTATTDGNFVLAGEETMAQNRQFLLLKITAQGDTIWTKSWGGSESDVLRAVVSTTDGGCVVAGYSFSTTAGYEAILTKINQNGSILWEKQVGSPLDEFVYALAQTNDDGFLMAGFQTDGTGNDKAWLAKTDSEGDLFFQKTIDTSSLKQIWGAAALPNGDFVFTGETRLSLNADRDLFLLKTDSAGNTILSKKFGQNFGERGYAVLPEIDGGFALAGHKTGCGSTCTDAWLIRTDSLGKTFAGVLRGHVSLDLVGNCQPNASNPTLAGWTVGILGPSGVSFSTTDATGFFEKPLDAGAFEAFLIPPSVYWQSCNDTFPFVIGASGDTVLYDFLVKKMVQSPLMQVNLATARLRRCFENTYSVRACNLGTTAATNAKIEIELDPFLTATTASLPFTQSNQTLTFLLGTMQPLDCQRFTFNVVVNCDSTQLGQTHCTTAHAFPDSIALPSLNWDSSSVEVHATCSPLGDTLNLTMKNVGAGPMSSQTGYVIIEDVVFKEGGNIQLPPSDQTTIAVAQPNGKTYTLLAEQTPGHPGNSHPRIAVEGCGSMPFSTGYVLQFPQDDGDPFVDMDCRENVGAFDPNDKQAEPRGYKNEHFIEPNDEIEYLLRFQNTGSDTAFRVEVRDSLSLWLDPTAVEIGASSHSVRLEKEGDHILRFIFKNILLPDSTTNLAASQGFVKFRIKLKKGVPLGTIIENRGAIFFDFNAPIFTNKTHHTIELFSNFIEKVDLENPENEAVKNELFIAPNPFSESTKISWSGDENESFQIQLTNELGRVVFEKKVFENHFLFQKNNLPSGVYFLDILKNGQPRARGKMVLR